MRLRQEVNGRAAVSIGDLVRPVITLQGETI